MMSLQSKLRQIGEALAEVTENTFHYWRPVKDVPCILWAESGEGTSFNADNHKAEQNIVGTCDLYTKTEFDPLVDAVQAVLDGLDLTWRLASVQYEEDTNLIHYEWDWGVTFHG